MYLKDSSSSYPTTSTTAEPTKCSLVNQDSRIAPGGSGEFASRVQNLNAVHFDKGSGDLRSQSVRFLSRSNDEATQLDSNQIPPSAPFAACKADGSSRIDSRAMSSESRYKVTESISPGLATLISSSPNTKQASDEVTEEAGVVPGTMQKQRSQEEAGGSQDKDDEDDDFVLGQEALEEIELLEKESIAKEDSLTRPGTCASVGACF